MSTVSANGSSVGDMIALAEGLVSAFASRAERYDADASFPQEDIDDLRREGFLGLMVPRSLGGIGAGFHDYLKVAMVLARGNASTALVFNMHAAVTGALAGIPDEMVRGLGAPDAFFEFRDQFLRSAIAGAMYGVAITEAGIGSKLSELKTTYSPEGDGYLLQGRKSVCSGAGHLSAYLIAARATAVDFGDPCISYFVVPAGEGISVEHTWDPLGMRATASNAMRLDVHVPAQALLAVECAAVPLAYAMPQWLVASYAAVYVGLAEGAFEHALRILEDRAPWSASVRSRLGRVETLVKSARLVLEHAANQVDDNPGEPETNRAVYRAKLLAGDVAMEAAASLSELCGLGALRRGEPLERIFRDARSGAIMPPRSDVCADYLGTTALGLDPQSGMESPPW